MSYHNYHQRLTLDEQQKVEGDFWMSVDGMCINQWAENVRVQSGYLQAILDGVLKVTEVKESGGFEYDFTPRSEWPEHMQDLDEVSM